MPLVLLVWLTADPGEDALARGDWQAALEAFSHDAPSDPAVLRGRCLAWSGLGQHAHAIDACRTARKLDDTPQSQLTLASVLLKAKTPAGLAEADKIVSAVGVNGLATADQHRRARFLSCEVVFALHQQARFADCAAGLARAFPSSPEALYLAYLGALTSDDTDAATALLDDAKAQGLPAEIYEASLGQIADAAPATMVWGRRIGRAFAAWGIARNPPRYRGAPPGDDHQRPTFP
jgi:hypothetical protein